MSGGLESQLSKPTTKKPTKLPPLKSLVSAKMAVADIQGAVRILTSKETILPYSVATANKLKDKHPQPHPDSQQHADPDDREYCFKTNKEKLLKALHSFRKGAGGGPDGFLPQHLLDITEESL